ncbi:MAG: hypothetical protein H0W24_10585 [Lysobacter sp.]|nr:hypothetical protein [Lysobacter sp.]MDQ3205065.1 hypothetical protein [Pseudomonadota bacterium]
MTSFRAILLSNCSGGTQARPVCASCCLDVSDSQSNPVMSSMPLQMKSGRIQLAR